MFDFTLNLRLPPEFFTAVDRIVTAINLKGNAIMNDLSLLNAAVAALETKAAETNATLAGLAQAIVDLKASGDVQAGIDALTVQAEGILAGLSAAEDAADDQLPPAPPAP